MVAPSGALQVACWRCRQLTQEAAQLEVRPPDLKYWRAKLWARLAWLLLWSTLGGCLAGLLGMGLALLGSMPVYRLVELSMGGFITTFALMMGAGTWLIWEKSTIELAKLRVERLEARRLS
jgi:hypothetical protein